MCRIFKTTYACGHRDIIKAPCEWRDEGRIDILGRRVHCENSTRSLADLGRLCMICSQDISRQDLVDLKSSNRNLGTDSYIMCDQKDVMARIIRNESYLRKREKLSRVIPTPPTPLGSLTQSELHYRCCVNEEFLARRLKRRYLQQRFDNRGEYQDFFEAHKAHVDAATALNDSIFSLRDYVRATTQFKNNRESATQTATPPIANASTQTNGLEGVVISYQHTLPNPSLKPDEFSMTLIGSSSAGPRIPLPTDSAQLDHPIGKTTGARLRHPTDCQWDQEELESLRSIRDDEEGTLITFSEEESPGSAEIAGNAAQGEFSEWPGLVDGLANEVAERGMSRPDPPQSEFELDSPEGVARLMDLRLFLGMRPDTQPLDMWNFAIRNSDLISNITGNTLPIRHRQIGEAKRPGFDRDSGLDTVIEYAEDKWELRERFVDTWNSLRWIFEPQSQSAQELPGSPTDTDDGRDEEPAIDEFCRVLLVEKDSITYVLKVDDIDGENEIEQSEDHKQQKGEEESGQTFKLEGKRAMVSFEAGFRGKAIAPRYQARVASPLHTSWTYADPENVVSYPDWQDEVASPLPSTCTATALRDGNWSNLSPYPACPTSQNALVPHLVPDVLSALKYWHGDTIPPLFLENGSTSIEGRDLLPDLGDSTIEGTSPSRSTAPGVYESVASPYLIEPTSAAGMTVLSRLRQYFAMPDSKTPQEISTFIDLHPGLMRAIRTGHVPAREVPTTLDRSRQSQQKTRAAPDPMHAVRATRDQKQRLMQKNLILALKRLDWDEIDSAPVPFAPSSPWHGLRHAEAEPHDDNDDDGDEEEEDFNACERMKVCSTTPDGLSRAGSGYHHLLKHQVKNPSPLRTVLARREPKVQLETARIEGGGADGETAAVLFDVEVWDEVDLNVSGTLSWKET